MATVAMRIADRKVTGSRSTSSAASHRNHYDRLVM